MKKFRYEAVDERGNSSEGILEADSFEAVLYKLLKAKRYPMRIEELTQQSLIALGRLEKMKELRSKLQPREIPPDTIEPPKRTSKTNWIIPLLIVLWIATLVAYLLTTAL